MEKINYSNNMLNDAENQEISPPGLSLQNDSVNKSWQKDENEKYTKPILETNKLDVKSQQRRHCEICNITYKRQRILKDHLEFFHEMDNNLVEDDDESETESENDYDFEMFSQNSKESEEMEENFDFNNQNEDKPPLPSLETEHETKIENDFESKPGLDSQENEKKKKYTCDQCEKEYFHSHNLLRHKHIVHNGQKDHECDSCGKAFSRTGDLKIHIDTVHNSQKCELCGKSFSGAEHLKRHINRVHNGQKDHKCDSCGKAFSQAGHLRTHVNAVHNRQKDHKCDSCEKSFSRAGHLKIHINSVHNGQKDHKCDSCGKSFSQPGNLKTHINSVHNGQKDHKCDSCGKAFSLAHNLKKHINLVHSGQRYPKCDLCGKAFCESGSLKRHINAVHNGLKDHKCVTCGKFFSRKEHLHRHLNSIHNFHSESSLDSQESKKKKEYACNQCEKVFLQRKSLLYHMKTSHYLKITFKFKKSIDNCKQLITEGKKDKNKTICKRCKSPIFNENHEKLCSKYANLIKNNQCSLCGDVFYSKSKGYYHIKNVHFAKKLELKCSKLNTTEKIDSSELIEEDDNEKLCSKYANLIKNNQCSLCGDVFYSKSKGYYHIKNVHFAKKLELKCTKINTTEKIDSAELIEDDNENCQKQNTHKKIENPQNLLLGQRIHQNMSNDENFNESELDSQNNELSDADQNKNVHKKEKRKYPCTICGKTFNVNSNLIKHQSKKHKHSCDFCNRKFSKISKLLQHKLNAHEDKKEYTEMININEDKSKIQQSKPKAKSSGDSDDHDPILRNMLQALSEI